MGKSMARGNWQKQLKTMTVLWISKDLVKQGYGYSDSKYKLLSKIGNIHPVIKAQLSMGSQGSS